MADESEDILGLTNELADALCLAQAVQCAQRLEIVRT